MKLDSYQRFEITAHAFHRMTGMMAPGKDVPAAAGPSDHDARDAAMREWSEKFGPCVIAVLKAVEDLIRE
jgi:hypothetical protein